MFGARGRVREIGWGGAKNSGKTELMGPLALRHVAENPKWGRALILRETYGDLSDLLERMEPKCRAMGGVHNKSEKVWRFPGGASIRFGYLSKGCSPYWGKEFSLIIIDEITRCIATEREYLLLLGSLRNSHGVPCQVISLTNPGGKGHNWWKARFKNVPARTIQRDDNGLERVFIPASIDDNPHATAEDRAQLDAMPEAERRAFKDGDWDAFEGAVFRLERGIHVWDWAQFRERTGHDKIPADWTRFRSLDWGFAHPFAVYWYAVDHDGRAYVYREWYGVAKDGKGGVRPNVGVGLTPEDVAEKIASIERDAAERIATGWAGPDLWFGGRGDYGGGRRPVEAFEARGVFWQPWDASAGSRLAGKMALHSRLAFTRDDEGQVSEWPGIILIAEETPHAQRTIPALEYDRHQPELVDKEGEDHAFDSLSGFCKMRAWKPVRDTRTPADRLLDRHKPKGGASWMAH